jgi:hypothetical protein
MAVGGWRLAAFSAFLTPKGYETRPHRYAKRWGRDLAQETVGFERRFSAEGPWELSPGFSLGSLQ